VQISCLKESIAVKEGNNGTKSSILSKSVCPSNESVLLLAWTWCAGGPFHAIGKGE
jgi:hypothetical protein